MAKSIRIAIVDDHASVRLGLRTELSEHEDLEVVGEAGDVQEAIDLVSRSSPDVLLLDMEIPGNAPDEDGVTVLSNLRKARSPARVLVYSGWQSEAYILSTLAEGVSGYILKTETLSTVVEAIRAVGGPSHEDGWFSRQVMARIARAKQSDLKLTRRELETLRLLHKTNEEIASSLGVFPNTVKKHVGNILAKFGVPSRTAAMERAFQMSLIPDRRG